MIRLKKVCSDLYAVPMEADENKISAVWESGRIIGNKWHTTCILVDGVEFEVTDDMEEVMILIESARQRKV